MSPDANELPGRPARIGIFGGTFDPVHYGHLAAARAARDELHLDVVLFVVANDPWKKWDRSIAEAEDRLAMVEAALDGESRLEASDIEIRRGGVSYTVDTIDELDRDHPGDRLFLIVGADVLAEMGSWERAARIGGRVTVVVITRPGTVVPPDTVRRWHAQTIFAMTPEVSSTEVRRRVETGEGITDLVPPAVARVIAESGLYRKLGTR